MNDIPVGQAPGAPGLSVDEDPDSPDGGARQSFFSRLFRREALDGAGSRPLGVGDADLALNLRRMLRLRVDDVSVPRADIVAIPNDASFPEVVAAFRASELSRLPVYAETLDRPEGLLLFKDVALRFGFGADDGGPGAGQDGAGQDDAGQGGAPFDLAGMLRPLLYVPPSMPLATLLQKMQSAHIHMALVIDEYGGVDGLVTIEDVVEQIVGAIADEHDEAEVPLWQEEAPGVYLAQARMDLEEAERAAGLPLIDADLAEEVDTLGGLVIRLAGRLPARGEVVAHPAGHEFEVVEGDARRLDRVRVRLAPARSAEAAE
ncbi:MAG: transporter associated domain-containing protein [Amaricoccus sp.]|uniref:transporter associated domain-containing protein n=1 Tax=Amaricoccus sp. TaxID=1872485 RepID=UPI0039E58FDF